MLFKNTKFIPVIIGLISVALSWIIYPTYAIDDAFIHLRFAESVSRGDGFSFNPGEPCFAFTSFLWVVLIAFFSKVLPALAAAKILGSIAQFFAILIFAKLLQKFALPDRFVLLGTFLFAIDPWLIRWSISGMESSLAALLAILIFYFFIDSCRTQKGFFLTGILCALGYLTRPELAFVIPLFIIERLIRSGFRDGLKQSLFLSAGVAILVIPYWLWLFSTFGTIIPNTVITKGILYGQKIKFASVFFYAVKVIFSTYFLLIAAGLISHVWSLRIKSEKPFTKELTTIIIWAVMIPILYISRKVWPSPRYMLISLPFFILIGTIGLNWLYNHLKSKRHLLQFSTPILILLLLIPFLVTFITLPDIRGSEKSLRECHIHIGKWLFENGDPSMKVVAFDIGAIGYFSGMKVIDQGGLLDPSLLDERKRTERIRIEKPDFWVMAEISEYEIISRDLPYVEILEPVFSLKHSGYGPGLSRDFYLTLYKADWSKLEDISYKNR